MTQITRRRRRVLLASLAALAALAAAFSSLGAQSNPNYPPFELFKSLAGGSDPFGKYNAERADKLIAAVEETRTAFDADATRALLESHLYWGLRCRSDQPRISADGQAILYVARTYDESPYDEEEELWLWRASDGSRERANLLPPNGPYRTFEGVFAMNAAGTRVAFATKLLQNKGDLYDRSIEAWLWQPGQETATLLGVVAPHETPRDHATLPGPTASLRFANDGERLFATVFPPSPSRRGRGATEPASGTATAKTMVYDAAIAGFREAEDANLRDERANNGGGAVNGGALWLDGPFLTTSGDADSARQARVDSGGKPSALERGIPLGGASPVGVATRLKISDSHSRTADERYVAFASTTRFDGEKRLLENSEAWRFDAVERSFEQVSDGRLLLSLGGAPPPQSSAVPSSHDLLKLAWAGDAASLPLLRKIVALPPMFIERNKERWRSHPRLAMALLGEPFPLRRSTLDQMEFLPDVQAAIQRDGDFANAAEVVGSFAADEAFEPDAFWTEFAMAVESMKPTDDGGVLVKGSYRRAGKDKGSWTMRLTRPSGDWIAVDYSNYFGPLNGHGYLAMLRRVGDRWALVHFDSTWVS